MEITNKIQFSQIGAKQISGWKPRIQECISWKPRIQAYISWKPRIQPYISWKPLY